MLDVLNFLVVLPPEFLLAAECVASLLFIALFYFLYGKAGLYVYTSLAVIIANIQVLRLGFFSFLTEPIALGTVLFTSTYFVADILTEHYGVKESRKIIGVSFLSMAFVPVFMGLVLLFPSRESTQVDKAIHVLFSPVPRLLMASFISYAVSQYLDIYIFQKIKQLTHSKYLGARSILSLLTSGFIDNIVFCTLAWVVLSPQPVGWSQLWYSYILGTYVIRLGTTCLFAPCLYFFRKPY